MCKSTLVLSAPTVQRERWMWRRLQKDQLVAVRARERVSASALGLVCAALAGCLGGQTGSEDEKDYPPPRCEPEWNERELRWDERSQLGLLPAEARALVVGEHVATLSWDDANVHYSFEPEHGQSQIVIDVAPPLALPKLITNGCDSSLSFVSSVTLSTAGGALVEQLQGVFSADSGSHVDLKAQLSLDALTGLLTVSAKEGQPPTQLHVRATFEYQRVSGVLSASAAVSEFGSQFACWPSGITSCGSSL